MCGHGGQRSAADLQSVGTAASYGAVVPRSSCAVVTHEENVGTKCICTILIDDLQRIDTISKGFTHLASL